MFKAVPSSYLVPFDGSFEAAGAPTGPARGHGGGRKNRAALDRRIAQLSDLQEMLYAEGRYAVLLIFQALDAAGKDGTIRAVMTGVNPAGCQVFSFKQPSAEELAHDFLWRTTTRLPERGRIGIFNRSYYEEVLVVRVHPELLRAQNLPDPIARRRIWTERFESIREHERHLARNGVVILKFWLNVSKAEQRKRFLSRLDRPHKHWKFSERDVRERGHWDAYMAAYQEALAATSRPWAPWYAVPADSKPFMRRTVADLLVRSLRQLGVAYPAVSDTDRVRLEGMRRLLAGEE
jgi:PPK2 family polyphosphate:nucleotide phosphotransferase